MKEKDIQAKIVKWLKLWKHNSYFFKIPAGRFSRSGLSDIVGIYKRNNIGIFVALEIKTATGKLSALQRDFLTEVIEKGGVAVVLRSLEDCKILFFKLEQGESIQNINIANDVNFF